ncbi:hypothetical protein [Flavobacterium luteolum]|uniref:hypothetical protein n=1 Tax=Flavobacterium luteolum TaxID=3003259 RepID=UPI00248EB11F|nr:hypothetical protein [Flavobacterium luteolum]
MRSLKNLNIRKSIERRKLVFSENWFDKFNSGNVIIYNSLNYLAINPRFQTSRIFILDKKDIYFTMIKENQKLNVPVLFSQISLKRALKNLCQ